MPSTQRPEIARHAIARVRSGLQLIHGVYHRPQVKIAGDRRPGVLFLHDLMGSKDQPHRLLRTAADNVAAAGGVALRVDLRGRGDSHGQSIDVTPSNDIKDTYVSLYALAAEPDVAPNSLALVGLGWGGTVAACVAKGDQRVKAVVLWSSLPVDLEWHPEFLEYEGRLAANVGGCLLGSQFYDELRHIRPLEALVASRAKVLVVRGEFDTHNTLSQVQAVERQLSSAGLEYTILHIPGADHRFTPPTAQRDAIEKIVAWLHAELSFPPAPPIPAELPRVTDLSF